MLKEIQGRATDFVVARDGTVMHGLALIYILRDLPQVAGFKIMQESSTLPACRWCWGRVSMPASRATSSAAWRRAWVRGVSRSRK